MFQERGLMEFEDLRAEGATRVRVRLVERGGRRVFDVRKVRDGIFLRQGLEFTPEMLRRLVAQAKVLLQAETTHAQPGPAPRPRQKNKSI